MTPIDRLEYAILQLSQRPVAVDAAKIAMKAVIGDIALLQNALTIAQTDLAIARVSAGMVRAELAPANEAVFPPLVGDA